MSGLGSMERGQRAEGFGIRGAMCHLKLQGHLAVFYKGTRLLSVLFCQPFITVITVADTVRIRITAT